MGWRDGTERRVKEKSARVSVTLHLSAQPDTEGCDRTWKKFHGHCYRYFSRRHTWEDAEKDCREHNGHLASVHSPAEQSFVRGEWERTLAAG